MLTSTLPRSFSVSLTRPGDFDDTNIVFLHGSPVRKGQKGQDANAENSRPPGSIQSRRSSSCAALWPMARAQRYRQKRKTTKPDKRRLIDLGPDRGTDQRGLGKARSAQRGDEKSSQCFFFAPFFLALFLSSAFFEDFLAGDFMNPKPLHQSMRYFHQGIGDPAGEVST
jgi:hypothetical protein